MTSPQAAAQSLRCEQHGATAGWKCTGCHHVLCPDCTATRRMAPVFFTVCTRCGDPVEQLLQKKGVGSSLAQRLPGAFLFPFKTEGLTLWLAMAFWLWITTFLGLVGFVLGWGAALASLFGLTRSTARGSEGLDVGEFSDVLGGAVLPLTRFAVAMAPAWVGALAAKFLGQPWLYAVALGVTVLWSPTAFIGAAANANLVHLLNPVRVLGTSARLGKDFGVYVAGLVAVSFAMLLSVPIALVFSLVPVPVFSGVLAQVVLLYAPLVGARVAGQVLMLHGPAFGWGEEVDSYEPVLPGVEPRGLPPEPTRSLPKHLPDAIELEPEPAPAPPPAQRGDRFAAIEVNPDAEAPAAATFDVALLPSHGAQSASEIRKSIAARRTDAALDGFRATGLSAAEALSFDELLWLGQTAAQHIDYESAELAFSRAAERKAPAEALGRARVMLARLLAERMNRKADATSWMKRIVAEHAGTSAATYATEWLSKESTD